MSYLQLTYLHLASVVPAFIVGSILLIRRKGTSFHRTLGKVYMVLMLVTAATSLLMRAEIGPQFLGHFGYIHLLCALVIYTVPVAYFSIRRGNVKRHKRAMIILYISALWIAGFFTLMPGRFLHRFFFD